MVWTSIKLFLAGKLFQNPLKVFGLSVVGVAVTLAVAFALLSAGLAPALAAGLAGFGGGLLQPFLFKNLKYQ